MKSLGEELYDSLRMETFPSGIYWHLMIKMSRRVSWPLMDQLWGQMSNQEWLQLGEQS